MSAARGTADGAPRAAALVDALLAPADALRRAWLRALGPLARRVVAPRETRVALAASASMAVAFALACAEPLWLLALGPVLLGVPHVAADLRYLVARPGLHRRPALWLAAGVPVVAAASGLGVRAALAGAALTALVARAGAARRSAVALGALAVLAVAWRAGPIAEVVAAHAHNFIAVGFWWAWRRREGRAHWVPLALFAVLCAALLAGAAGPVLALTGGDDAPASGASLEAMAEWMAPGLSPAWGARAILLFAFAQSVHYAVWLRLVPDEDRPGTGPRSFRQSARAAGRDLGAWVAGAFALAALAMALWALADLRGAREGYLRFARFHGYLEITVAALFLAEGRRR